MESYPSIRPLRVFALTVLLGLLLLLASHLEDWEAAEDGSGLSASLPAGAEVVQSKDLPCRILAEPSALEVGQRIDWRVELRSAEGWPASTQILLGMDPAWYASRAAYPGAPHPPEPLRASAFSARIGSEALEVKVQEASEDRRYATVDFPQARDASAVFQLDWNGSVSPHRPQAGFAPLVLVDLGGSGRFSQWCMGQGVEIRHGSTRSLSLRLPSEASPDAELGVLVRAIDAFGNPSGALEGNLSFAWEDAISGVNQGAAVAHQTGDSSFSLAAPSKEGLYRLQVAGEAGQARSNPLAVRRDRTHRLVWADLRGHSASSGSWGSPDAFYRWARDVAGLDAAALSDPDWQLGAGDFEAGLSAADKESRSGSFVAVPALEYRQFGHEVAYFFRPEGLVGQHPEARDGARSRWAHDDLAEDPARLVPAPAALFQAHGDEGLWLATHSSLDPARGTGFPIGAPHPRWGSLEIYSARGSSECKECPRSLWQLPGPDAGRYGSAQEALASGALLGFLASGGGEDGRPGSSLWGKYSGGLTALRVRELSRDGVQEALEARRHYATTGARILLEVELNEARMGAVVAPRSEPSVFRFRAAGETPILSARLIVDGALTAELLEPPSDRWVEIPLKSLQAPSSIYLALEFRDGELAWSSPIFVREGANGVRGLPVNVPL